MTNKYIRKTSVFIGLSWFILSAVALLINTQRVYAFAGGDGSSESPFQITTPAELASISSYLGSGNSGKYFKLMNDIDLNVAPYNTSTGWDAIGTSSGSSAFYGKFDGNGKTVSNLFINKPSTYYQGIFGYVAAGGIVENLKVTNVNVTGGQYLVGGAIGENYGTARKIGVEGGTVSGLMRLGGVLGENQGTATELYSTGLTITQRSASIDCCVGGIVGSNERGGNISDSYSRSNIVHTSGGQGSFGGVIGNTYNSGTMTRLYSTGSITTLASFPSNVGGLIGNNYVSSSSAYWDTQTSGLASSASGTGKTTAEMKTQGTFTGWDFTNTWAISPTINDGYPYLRSQSVDLPPSLTTSAVSDISYNQTTLNGNVTSAGTSSLTGRGFVWGKTSKTPGTVAPASSGYDTVTQADSVSTGTYFKSVSSLTHSTTYYVRAFATSSVGTTYGDEVSFTTSVSSDVDSDGIITTEEAAGPNSGDANNDGTGDSLQANVSSFKSNVTNKYVTVALDSACSVTDVGSQSEASNSTKDNDYEYPSGFLNFSANCGTPGYTTTVKLYFFGAFSANSIARKYIPGSGQYINLSGGYGATIQDVTIGGQSAVMVSYQVTDGSVLDIDGSANGTIVDPAGLAEKVSISNLANTGQNTRITLVLSSMLAIFGLVYEFGVLVRKALVK